MTDIYKDKWEPQNYLEEYYLTKEVAQDEICVYNFVLDFLHTQNKIFDEVLEIGCGPTIHHMVPFAPFARSIVLSDYLDTNLETVKKWVKGREGAHNWDYYIGGVLELEGKGAGQDEIKKRSKELRSKIKEFKKIDIFSSNPLGEKRTFPLIASFYCAECATLSKGEWSKGLKNMFTLLDPGGWFLSSALRNTSHYKVLGRDFPSANIDENDVKTTLLSTGFFDPDSISTEVYHIDVWIDEGFDSIILFKAKRNEK